MYALYRSYIGKILTSTKKTEKGEQKFFYKLLRDTIFLFLVLKYEENLYAQITYQLAQNDMSK